MAAPIRRIVNTSSTATLVPFEWLLAPNSEKLYTSIDINLNPTEPYSDSMKHIGLPKLSPVCMYGSSSKSINHN
ncbi:hypothetical protein B0O99DRAFT_294132 [Bisporella sp. PMI_857]|nr:hypothetical protein B0O99DRAFT_294132 [Bisporella sp. PMI_857]